MAAEPVADRETAVLVPVPEAERVVSPHRSRLDGNVLYLAPRPDEPFRALTRAVCAAFPSYLPYGGAFADTIPHLTIGERERGGGRGAEEVADLRAAEAAVLSQLPIRFRVNQVWLMAGSDALGSWHTLAELPLALE